MDTDVMVTFNKTVSFNYNKTINQAPLYNFQLLSITEIKPPISKQKIVDVTKAALDAVKYFKHVVLAIEKFLVKVIAIFIYFCNLWDLLQDTRNA